MLSLSFFVLFGLSLLQGYRCDMCMKGYEYNNVTQQCEDIDECTINNVSPCMGSKLRSTCENTNGSYLCTCRPMPLPRKYGKYCNTTDPAADLYCMDNENGCNGNGVCENFEKCHCKKGYYGKFCELMQLENCSLTCWNNGTCITMFNDTNSTPQCMCAPGYSGRMCQYKLDLCAHSVCLNGGTCMSGMDPPCQCMAGYSGKYCEKLTSLNITCQECKDNITLPNSVICDNGTFTSCPCASGFYGSFCQFTMYECANGGVDVPAPVTFYKCICPEGVSGTHCTNDDVNECNMTECQNGGMCQDKAGYFSCSCRMGWKGRTCDVMDTSSSYNMTTVKPDTCMHRDFCPSGQEPWRDCSNYAICQMEFLDGMCTPQCNNEKCLYDGLECLNSTTVCMYSNCSSLYDNGKCDMHCNSSECAHDGNDCMSSMANVLGTVVLDIALRNVSDRSDNMSAETDFLAMTLPYRISSNNMVQLTVRKRGAMNYSLPMISQRVDNSSMTMFYRAYYTMANRAYCNMTNTCWSSVQRFAGYLAAIENFNTNMSGYQITRVSTCMDGYFGDGCMQKCNSNCNMTMSMYPLCDMETGTCTTGCRNRSFTGPMCDVICSPNCLSTSEPCHDNGTCKSTAMGTCRAGYSGPRCDMECQNGKYGIDCMKNCDSMCIGICNKMTGYCMCSTGYNFQNNTASCNKCMDTYYGAGCMTRCNAKCNNRMCNNANGTCQKPCSQGYTGDKCDQVCQRGQFGMNCSKTCDTKCKNKECNHITGNCNSCENNQLKPPDCLASQTTLPSASKQDYSSTVIAVIVVLVILIVVALVVAYILWKRSQEGKYDTNEIEERGLVLKDVKKERAQPNEYESHPEATLASETANGGVEKAPLIGEGQQFDTIDLTTPPADKNTNMSFGGVFDGNSDGAVVDPFAKQENGVTNKVTVEVEEPKNENDQKKDDSAPTSEDKSAEDTKEEGSKDVPYIDNVESTTQEKPEPEGERQEEKSEAPSSSSPDIATSEEVTNPSTDDQVDTPEVEKEADKDTSAENNVSDPDVDSKDVNKSDEEKT